MPTQALPKCQTRAMLAAAAASTWQRADESKEMGRACSNLPVSCLNEGLSPASAEHMARRTHPADEAVHVYMRPDGCREPQNGVPSVTMTRLIDATACVAVVGPLTVTDAISRAGPLPNRRHRGPCPGPLSRAPAGGGYPLP